MVGLKGVLIIFDFFSTHLQVLCTALPKSKPYSTYSQPICKFLCALLFQNVSLIKIRSQSAFRNVFLGCITFLTFLKVPEDKLKLRNLWFNRPTLRMNWSKRIRLYKNS